MKKVKIEVQGKECPLKMANGYAVTESNMPTLKVAPKRRGGRSKGSLLYERGPDAGDSEQMDDNGCKRGRG